MKYINLLLVAFLLSSCAPSQSSVQTAIAQTQSAIPTPTPTHEPSNVVYKTTLKNAIPSWFTAFQNLQNHTNAAKENRELLYSNEWNNQLKIYLDNLSGASHVMANLQPVPKNFEKTNEYLQSAVNETDLMIEAYRNIFFGSNDIDADLINTHAENAMLYMNLAAKEAEKYFK